jgi:hypothetical protein
MGSIISSKVKTDIDKSCGRGILNDKGSCYCFTGYSGRYCEETLEGVLPRSFLAWKIVFSIVSVGFAIYTGYMVFRSRTKQVKLKGNLNKYKSKWNLTSKKLIIMLIFALGTSKHFPITTPIILLSIPLF